MPIPTNRVSGAVVSSTDINAMAADVNTALASRKSNGYGLYSARPAANTVISGSTYYATDVQETYQALGTEFSLASSWFAVPAGGTELGYQQVTANQTIPVQTTQNTAVDLTGLVVSFKMPERPVEIRGQLLGRFDPTTANTGQDGTFQIRDVDTGLNLNEAHVGYSQTTSEFKSLNWSARIPASTPGVTRTFKLVGIGKTTGVLVLAASTSFPAFITAKTL